MRIIIKKIVQELYSHTYGGPKKINTVNNIPVYVVLGLIHTTRFDQDFLSNFFPRTIKKKRSEKNYEILKCE